MRLGRRVGMVASLVWVPALACGRLSGISEYDNVDCVRECGVASGDGAAPASGDAPSEALAIPDSTTAESGPPPFDAGSCPSGGARVVLTVTAAPGPADSVTSNPGALVVPADSTTPHTASECFGIGSSVRLELQNRSADWTGVSCKDPNPTGRCDFTVLPGGATIAAAVH
jgi:hypothetical protein